MYANLYSFLVQQNKICTFDHGCYALKCVLFISIVSIVCEGSKNACNDVQMKRDEHVSGKVPGKLKMYFIIYFFLMECFVGVTLCSKHYHRITFPAYV